MESTIDFFRFREREDFIAFSPGEFLSRCYRRGRRVSIGFLERHTSTRVGFNLLKNFAVVDD